MAKKMAKTKMEKMLKIGRCLAAHGIKGGFRFLLENSEDSVLTIGFKVFIQQKGQKNYQEFTIKQISFGHRVMAYLEGIENRNQVEELVPFDIYIQEDDLPRQGDEVYLRDLIGMELLSLEGEELVGKIESIYSNGVQDIVVYRDQFNKRKELPLIDQFFPEIRLDERKVIIDEPEFI